MKEMNANELERAEKIMEKVVDAFQGELGDKPKVNFVMHTLELIVGYLSPKVVLKIILTTSWIFFAITLKI